jgi:phosphopantothenoylcysteine decarboxylase/phosphopantothenate--cysteine ligase
VRFVITAGPTQEPIDPVRYISNRSSGRMGYALAEAAVEAGHSVVLISGRVNLAPPPSVRLIPVRTSDEMYDAVHQQLADCDVLIMCAAVADYKPAVVSAQKLKKTNRPVSLELVPTRDILASLPEPRSFFAVGFAAETNDVENNAEKKLRDKRCDMIVANDISRPDLGMESADNEVTIFFRDDQPKKISRAPKKKIARELIKIISNAKKNV